MAHLPWRDLGGHSKQFWQDHRHPRTVKPALKRADAIRVTTLAGRVCITESHVSCQFVLKTPGASESTLGWCGHMLKNSPTSGGFKINVGRANTSIWRAPDPACRRRSPGRAGSKAQGAICRRADPPTWESDVSSRHWPLLEQVPEGNLARSCCSSRHSLRSGLRGCFFVQADMRGGLRRSGGVLGIDAA